MNKFHVLSTCMAATLLTACGSGSSAGTEKPNNNIQNTTAGKLPYEHTVPDDIKQDVQNKMRIPIDWDALPGEKPFTVGNRSYNKGDYFDLTSLDKGINKTNYSENHKKYGASTGEVSIYRQNYSVIMNTKIANSILPPNYQGTIPNEGTRYTPSGTIGYLTTNAPNTGKAVYKGKSFVQNEIGELSLSVDFGNKTVSGQITGIKNGDVLLKETSIQPFDHMEDNTRTKAPGYSGVAELSTNGKFIVEKYENDTTGITSTSTTVMTNDTHVFQYKGFFFGPKAEETAGSLYAEEKLSPGPGGRDTVLNFAGQRDKITK